MQFRAARGTRAAIGTCCSFPRMHAIRGCQWQSRHDGRLLRRAATREQPASRSRLCFLLRACFFFVVRSYLVPRACRGKVLSCCVAALQFLAQELRSRVVQQRHPALHLWESSRPSFPEQKIAREACLVFALFSKIVYSRSCSLSATSQRGRKDRKSVV